MPDNLKHLQDLDVPFVFGMVAQAKSFIIDRAMLSLIIVFLGAGITSGGLMYQINAQGKTIDKMMIKQDKMMEIINAQNVKIARIETTLHSIVRFEK